MLVNHAAWTLTAELQRRIRAMEMRYYRKILRISFKDHATDEEVCAKIQRAIGPRRPPDHRKETQTAVVWTYVPFIRSDQNHLARHSETGRKTRQTEEEMGRKHRGMDRPGVRQAPERCGEQGKMEETGCEIVCVPQRPSWLGDR